MAVYVDASKYIETLRLVRQRLSEAITAGGLIHPDDLRIVVLMVDDRIQHYEELFSHGEES